jgi:hypothetical protein
MVKTCTLFWMWETPAEAHVLDVGGVAVGSRKWTLSVAQSQGLAELRPAAPMSKLKKNEVIHCRSCSNVKRWFSLQHLSRWLLMFDWYGGAFLERRNLFSSAYRFVGHLS